MAKENNPKDKNKEKPVNTRPLPAIIVLSAALISCAFSLVQGVEFRIFVGRLLFSVVIFGLIGVFVRVILDRFFFNRNSNEEETPETEEQNEGEEGASQEASGENEEES